ncbi:polymer-forming cytoskeletal protein [Anaerolineales bacterium HSG24]|nr:polymer-forming cytoskeletal protein [Anaerolineales bacterium HSG24]
MRKLLALIIVLSFTLLCTLCSLGIVMSAVVDGIDISPDGRVFAGDNVDLQNETIDDDVVLLGGNLNIDRKSVVDGDFVVFGGNGTIDGTVNGDVAIFGGNLTLGSESVVQGDVGVIGGNANIDINATILGNIETVGGRTNRYESTAKNGRAPPEAPKAPKAPEMPEPPEAPKVFREHDKHDDYDDEEDFEAYREGFREEFRSEWERDGDWNDRGSNFVGDVFGTFFGIIGFIVSTLFSLVVVAVVSWLVAALLPEQTKTVGDTVTENWLLSFGVGLVTFITAVALLALVCLIVPIPIFLVMIVGMIFGKIAIGQIIGEKLLIALDRPFPNFTTSTIVGTMVLALISMSSDILGCFGFFACVFIFLVGLTGLGAVVLSRFGTQPYEGDGSFAGYTPSGFGDWSSQRRTQWPDPNLDLDEEPKSGDDDGIDLDKA